MTNREAIDMIKNEMQCVLTQRQCARDCELCLLIKPEEDILASLVMAIEALEGQKTGRWIHDGYDHPHGVDWMHCSECGKRDVFCPNTMTNYCPNCGAKMEVQEV